MYFNVGPCFVSSDHYQFTFSRLIFFTKRQEKREREWVNQEDCTIEREKSQKRGVREGQESKREIKEERTRKKERFVREREGQIKKAERARERKVE